MKTLAVMLLCLLFVVPAWGDHDRVIASTMTIVADSIFFETYVSGDDWPKMDGFWLFSKWQIGAGHLQTKDYNVEISRSPDNEYFQLASVDTGSAHNGDLDTSVIFAVADTSVTKPIEFDNPETLFSISFHLTECPTWPFIALDYDSPWFWDEHGDLIDVHDSSQTWSIEEMCTD
jgi:hypothetical protein